MKTQSPQPTSPPPKQCRPRLSSKSRQLVTHAQRNKAETQDAIALDQLKSLGVQVVAADAIDLPAMRLATQEVARQQRQSLPPDLLRAYFQGMAH